MTPPRIAIPVLLLCAALLGACGKGGRSAGTVTSATVTVTQPASPPSQGGRLKTRAQALAFASAVNLTAADLPGFHASPRSREEGPSREHLERAMQQCLGGARSGRRSAGHALVEQGSKDFQVQDGILSVSVSSEVSVASSPQAALGELSTMRSAKARSCLAGYLDRMFEEEFHGAVGKVSIASGTPPAHGAAGSFGWRISATITAHGVRLPFYLDILGFVDGPAEVSLTSSGLPEPFPARIEQRLFLLLLSRAQAAGA